MFFNALLVLLLAQKTLSVAPSDCQLDLSARDKFSPIINDVKSNIIYPSSAARTVNISKLRETTDSVSGEEG